MTPIGRKPRDGRPGALLVLLLTGPAAGADVTASAVADRAAARLSDVVRVTLAVEGPAPLRVEAPADIPDESTASVWRVRADGPAAVTDLPGGRQRWTRAVRAEPWAVGELRLGFAPATAFAGADPTGRRVDWPAVTVTVKTDLPGPDPTLARPITDVEDPPAPPPADAVPGWAFVAAAAGLAGLLAALMRAFRRRATPPPLSADVWAAREMAGLDDPAVPAAGFAAAVSLVVRGYVERRTGTPATHRTTAELLAALTTGPWPVDAVAELGGVLRWCDAARFAPEPAADDRAAVLAAARRFVAAPLTPPPEPPP